MWLFSCWDVTALYDAVHHNTCIIFKFWVASITCPCHIHCSLQCSTGTGRISWQVLLCFICPFVCFHTYQVVAASGECCNGNIMFSSCPLWLLPVPAFVLVASALCYRYFFCFARTLNGLWWNLREVLTIMNRLNSYIVSEIRTGTMERDITEYSNRRQLVLL